MKEAKKDFDVLSSINSGEMLVGFDLHCYCMEICMIWLEVVLPLINHFCFNPVEMLKEKSTLKHANTGVRNHIFWCIQQ